MFCVLWPFSKVIAHSFGIPGRFTCFRVMTKNSSFLHFMDISMSYFPQFWGSRAIYMFGRYEQKLFFLRFMAVFMSYCPLFWGSKAIDMFERYDKKFIVFCILWPFS